MHSTPTVACLCDEADQRLFATATRNNVHPLQPHNDTNFTQRILFLMNATLCWLSYVVSWHFTFYALILYCFNSGLSGFSMKNWLIDWFNKLKSTHDDDDDDDHHHQREQQQYSSLCSSSNLVNGTLEYTRLEYRGAYKRPRADDLRWNDNRINKVIGNNVLHADRQTDEQTDRSSGTGQHWVTVVSRLWADHQSAMSVGRP